MTRVPVLYDPDCGFCRVCVAVLLRWDRRGRLRPVALGTEEADRLLGQMPADEQMASWHLVERSGGTAPGVRSAGAAFSPLFRLLPGAGPLARLTERFPTAAERAYRFVADRRSSFGRLAPGPVRRWADRVISGSGAGGR
jgi:predicted DCC family thiol-disulfide oxidoreductase YuxK